MRLPSIVTDVLRQLSGAAEPVKDGSGCEVRRAPRLVAAMKRTGSEHGLPIARFDHVGNNNLHVNLLPP